MADVDVQALLFEREGYVLRGLANRVAQVDAELARLGFAVDDTPDAAPEVAVEVPDVETAAPAKGRRRKPAGA